ncbi:MAG TPA: tetratricopeptide repeat protein [Pyrinomonadaceae bacterium]|nr:tetratricopeptide repeat protein [Pyrinomonadaceae bacterium]
MTKENILFAVCGVLLGFIVGFFFANSVNQSAAAPRAAQQPGAATGSLPPGHPDVSAQEQAARQAASESARKARETPDDFDAQMRAAEDSYRAGDVDDSLSFLLRANQLRPDDQAVVVALGNVNYDADRFETAEKWYTAALMKDPNNVNVRTDLGLTFLLRRQPDVDRAIAEFRRSLERDPRHELALQNLVVALKRKGDLGEARATLAKLEGINPSNSALPMLRQEVSETGAAPAPANGG